LQDEQFPAANQIVVNPTVTSSIIRSTTTRNSQIILIVSGVNATTCTSFCQISFLYRKDGRWSFFKTFSFFLIFQNTSSYYQFTIISRFLQLKPYTYLLF